MAECAFRFSFHRAFLGVVKETDDLAGQHELITENMMTSVYKELQSLHNELKLERRKVWPTLVFHRQKIMSLLFIYQNSVIKQLPFCSWLSCTSTCTAPYFRVSLYCFVNMHHHLRPQQNEDTLWWQHCVLQCCPLVAKRGNIVVRPMDTRNVIEDFRKQYCICVHHNCCMHGKTSQRLRNRIMSAMLPPPCVLVLPGPYAVQNKVRLFCDPSIHASTHPSIYFILSILGHLHVSIHLPSDLHYPLPTVNQPHPSIHYPSTCPTMCPYCILPGPFAAQYKVRPLHEQLSFDYTVPVRGTQGTRVFGASYEGNGCGGYRLLSLPRFINISIFLQPHHKILHHTVWRTWLVSL